mmetsp:Transcript_43944/g.139996  ORF Transcript_43944/g.139996 Transcript_43944/m.139996 type:complete len:300 (+) Transcript_43944:860-1759(+)
MPGVGEAAFVPRGERVPWSCARRSRSCRFSKRNCSQDCSSWSEVWSTPGAAAPGGPWPARGAPGASGASCRRGLEPRTGLLPCRPAAAPPLSVSCSAAAPAESPSSTRRMRLRSRSSVWSVRSRMDAAPAEMPSSMRPMRPRMVASSSEEKPRSCASRSFRSRKMASSNWHMRASRASRARRSAASSPSRRATSARRPGSPEALPAPAAPSPHSSRSRRCSTATSSSSHATRRSKPACARGPPLTEVLSSLIVEGPGALTLEAREPPSVESAAAGRLPATAESASDSGPRWNAGAGKAS